MIGPYQNQGKKIGDNMKNKKFLLIVLLLLFTTTGCSVNYDVEIYNNKVNEKIEISDPSLNNSEALKNYIEDLFFKYTGDYELLSIREFKNYDNNKSNAHSLVSEKTYNSFKEYYENLHDIKGCCRTIDLSDNGTHITYRALGYNKWFDKYSELDGIKLRVKSNHKLVETNADEIEKGYIYIWDINRSNYKEKVPYLKLESKKYVFNYENEFLKNVLTIGGLAAIIVGGPAIAYFVVKGKQKKVNKI